MVKRNVSKTWKEETDEKAEKCLAIAKEIEKEQKSIRHWVKKPDGTMIYALKKYTKEQAIENHNRNVKETDLINDLKWKNKKI